MTLTKNQKWMAVGAVVLILGIVGYKKGWFGKKEDPFVIAENTGESQTRPAEATRV